MKVYMKYLCISIWHGKLANKMVNMWRIVTSLERSNDFGVSFGVLWTLSLLLYDCTVKYWHVTQCALITWLSCEVKSGYECHVTRGLVEKTSGDPPGLRFSTLIQIIKKPCLMPLRKIVRCACAGMRGTFSPTSKETASWRSRHASPHVRHACAVMHVGIANLQWRWKLSRHSRHMRNPQFYVSGKRSMGTGQSPHTPTRFGVDSKTLICFQVFQLCCLWCFHGNFGDKFY